MRDPGTFNHPIHPIHPGPHALLCDLLPFLCVSAVSRLKATEKASADLTEIQNRIVAGSESHPALTRGRGHVHRFNAAECARISPAERA